MKLFRAKPMALALLIIILFIAVSFYIVVCLKPSDQPDLMEKFSGKFLLAADDLGRVYYVNPGKNDLIEIKKEFYLQTLIDNSIEADHQQVIASPWFFQDKFLKINDSYYFLTVDKLWPVSSYNQFLQLVKQQAIGVSKQNISSI